MSTGPTANDTITRYGVKLRRRPQTGPRGGKSCLYQSVEASETWGYWYHTAKQAAKQSNNSDRMTRP